MAFVLSVELNRSFCALIALAYCSPVLPPFVSSSLLNIPNALFPYEKNQLPERKQAGPRPREGGESMADNSGITVSDDATPLNDGLKTQVDDDDQGEVLVFDDSPLGAYFMESLKTMPARDKTEFRPRNRGITQENEGGREHGDGKSSQRFPQNPQHKPGNRGNFMAWLPTLATVSILYSCIFEAALTIICKVERLLEHGSNKIHGNMRALLETQIGALKCCSCSKNSRILGGRSSIPHHMKQKQVKQRRRTLEAEEDEIWDSRSKNMKRLAAQGKFIIFFGNVVLIVAMMMIIMMLLGRVISWEEATSVAVVCLLLTVPLSLPIVFQIMVWEEYLRLISHLRYLAMTWKRLEKRARIGIQQAVEQELVSKGYHLRYDAMRGLEAPKPFLSESIWSSSSSSFLLFWRGYSTSLFRRQYPTIIREIIQGNKFDGKEVLLPSTTSKARSIVTQNLENKNINTQKKKKKKKKKKRPIFVLQ
eukprot:jgi/Bigna1/145630/aug1.101_g20338